jgi:mono/diheme cytochrome c family protein
MLFGSGVPQTAGSALGIDVGDDHQPDQILRGGSTRMSDDAQNHDDGDPERKMIQAAATLSSDLTKRIHEKALGLSIFLAAAQVAQAADIEAGKNLAAAACAACHGANG